MLNKSFYISCMIHCHAGIHSYAGIIFWRDFAIFSHFFAWNRIQIPGVRKKISLRIFSHFTPQSLFFAHAIHFDTFRLFYTIGFRIIFAPLFVSYTIAGSFSTASRCVLSEFRWSDNSFYWFRTFYILGKYFVHYSICPNYSSF